MRLQRVNQNYSGHVMEISTYEYREFWDTNHSWEVTKFSLSPINLIVGRNAAGKTRVVNTIAFLARFLSQGTIEAWNSGHWIVRFLHQEQIYVVEFLIELGKVVKEEIVVDGIVRLSRNSDGKGRIYYESISKFLDFEMSDSMVAIVARRDKLQHPFLEPLFEWGDSMRLYQFSTDLGRNTIHLYNTNEANPENSEAAPTPSETNGSAAVKQYCAGYKHFQDEFDEAILSDLAEIGYPCTDINANTAPNVPFIEGNMPVVLQVQEVGLDTPTGQFEMSTGMFRALAVLVHINYAVMAGVKTSIIIDDIGEGLDFNRSKSLINLIIKKCMTAPIQLILTSNDRFVMNEVDIDLWHILDREGSRVYVSDKSSSPNQFSDFKYSGLSNFDFFALEAYKGVVH